MVNVTTASGSVSYSLDNCGYANDGIELPDPVRVILTQGPLTRQPVSENGPPVNYLNTSCTHEEHTVGQTTVSTMDCTFVDEAQTMAFTHSMHWKSAMRSPEVPLSGLISYTEIIGKDLEQRIDLTEWARQ